jgi:Cu(I)/Ag(I) efflux system periplasmic protein CusF
MKTRSTIVVSLACFVSGAIFAADMPGMKMEQPGGAAMEKTQTHHAVGVVKAMDTAKGTITLSHEPVASIKWPAMTMTFKANKDQLASVKSGERVNFEFTAKGMDATITAIKKAK